jgi:hypothetical protein
MIGFWDFKLSGVPPLLSFGVSLLMDLWSLTALLFFCVTVAYSYRSVLRSVLPQMRVSGREGDVHF